MGLGSIGCGYDANTPFELDQPYSSTHTLTHARALGCHPGFVLQAGIDPNPEARHLFTRLYGVPAYSDLANWWAASLDPELDLVVFAVPPPVAACSG